MVASRIPRKWLRLLAWPAVPSSPRSWSGSPPRPSASRSTATANWLALGPIQVQPSEIAKLAIVLWAADVYARKDKLLGSVGR